MGTPERARSRCEAAPRAGQGGRAVVPAATKPGMAGLGWAGQGQAERQQRIFCLQAHKCLYWARLRVSLGGDQESLQICQPGSNSLSLHLERDCNPLAEPRPPSKGHLDTDPSSLDGESLLSRFHRRGAAPCFPCSRACRAAGAFSQQHRLRWVADPPSHCVPRTV